MLIERKKNLVMLLKKDGDSVEKRWRFGGKNYVMRLVTPGCGVVEDPYPACLIPYCDLKDIYE